jgi:hypothetical protein
MISFFELDSNCEHGQRFLDIHLFLLGGEKTGTQFAVGFSVAGQILLCSKQ